MRMTYHVIALVCIIHVLGAAGVGAWLGASGRLSRDRVVDVKNVFAITVAEQRQQEAQTAELVRQAERQTERVEAMIAGSTAERLDDEQRRHELTLRQLERTRREIESLRDNLELSRRLMEKEKREVLDEKQAAEQRLAQIEQQLNDAGFKRAVGLLEQLPADQAKKMFLRMIEQDKVAQVVMYLESMQPRKAAAVLREFDQSHEVARAVELTERLRARGSDLVQQTESSG